MGSYVQSFVKENNYTFKKLVVTPSNIIMSIGDSKVIKLNNLAACKWTSSNKSIATVDNSGKVTAKKKGIVRITSDLYGKRYTCEINIK